MSGFHFCPWTIFKNCLGSCDMERGFFKKILKSDSHDPENVCQIKIFPSLVQKKYYHLFVWCLKMKVNEF